MTEPKYRPVDMIKIIRNSKEYSADEYGRIYVDSNGERIADINSDAAVEIHVDILGPESLSKCVGLYHYCEKVGFPIATPKKEFRKQKEVIRTRISELERISELLNSFLL